jgi:hypothetical protein
LRYVYWRPAYLSGVYQFEEFVRNVDVYQGPILSYGPAVLASQSVEYCNPPHASLVTRYHRPIYHYGQLTGYEDIPAMTHTEDACSVIEGQAFAQEAHITQIGGTPMLNITYSYPIYHSNPAYGTFIVGYAQRQEITPVSSGGGSSSQPISSAVSTSHAAAYLDIALRQLDTVESFDDYALVATNTYAQDIRDAFDLGLIVGKYNDTVRYFDPNAAITTGEMLNILARNLGASPAVQGLEAAAYLSGLGVSVPSTLDGALTLSTLESLARQVTVLDQAPKADLLVIRQVLDGTLAADISGSITRAYAVAMYRPATSLTPGSGSVVTSGTSGHAASPAPVVIPVNGPPEPWQPPVTPPVTQPQVGHGQPVYLELLFFLSD